MDYSSAIDIDFYQAKMLLAYHRSGLASRKGTMEAFSRKLPPNRSFMVACGTERIMEYLQNLKFTTDDIKLLKDMLDPDLIEPFSEADANYFASLDFSTLEIKTMRDGDIFFANEPIIQVSGPIGMCQYIEKHILGIINHDVRVASKTARIVMAAADKPVFEYGGRRAHEGITPEAARAAYITGFAGTSSVAAFAKYGIPISGTMGHVWIMSHHVVGKNKREAQQDSFKEWSSIFKNSTYLIDTYDTNDGALDAIKAARRNIGGVRLDSGDLYKQSIDVRRELNKSDGCFNSKIVATGDLNEYKILKLRKSDARIDVYAAGTEVVCTPDAPSCNFVYKLVTTEENEQIKDVAKLSSESGKGTLPSVKQIRRFRDPHTLVYTHDEIQRAEDERPEYAHDLLVRRFISDWSKEEWTLEQARDKFANTLSHMPAYLKLIKEYQDFTGNNYTVNVSEQILKIKQELLKGE